MRRVGQMVLGQLGVQVFCLPRVPLYQSHRVWPLAVSAPVAILSYCRVYDSLANCPLQMAVQVGLIDTVDAGGKAKKMPKLQV